MTKTEVFVVFCICSLVAALAFRFVFNPPISSGSIPEPAPKQKDPKWEEIASFSSGYWVFRAPTPTGWIVRCHNDTIFIQDPNHEWLK